MAENLQATLFQYAFSAHANNIFQKWTVFVFTESWSHDQLTQKAYFHSKWAGLSLRFQVAGYLSFVAGEVASSHGATSGSATSTVFQKALPPQKSNLHEEYSCH